VREHTVESGIHPSKVDQQTNHGHVDCRLFITLKLILEDLASLAALSHSININIRKIQILLSIRPAGEDWGLVLKDKLKELELNIFAPQRDTVLLLQMSNLVSRIDRPYRPVRLASRTNRHIVDLLLVVGFGLRERFVRAGRGFDLSHRELLGVRSEVAIPMQSN
jgi:hypothetical protein